MAIEKGDAEESKKAQSSDLTKELKLQLELMQKELLELKSKEISKQNLAGSLSPSQFAELIEVVSKSAKKGPDKEISADSFVNEHDIDPDDFDENGVVFCAYSTGYVIVDDNRQGLSVPTPYRNKIFFIYQGENKSRDSKGREVLNTYCAYLSRSKKEQEWLRKHRFYGLKFFESAKEALSTTSLEAQRLVRFIDAVMNMDQMQVIAACRSRGINISKDMQIMRVSLANHMLKESEEVKDKAYLKTLEENVEESLFVGKSDGKFKKA